VQLEERLSKRVNQLDATIQVMAKSNQTIWANQKELTKSQNLLDEQFAVSTRMAVMGLNLVFEKMGVEERVDADDIEKLFRQWAEFRARPDFRNFMMEWMLGVALEKLPPPPEPEPEAKEEGEANAQSDNGNTNPEEGVTEDSQSSQADDVPEVQPEDRAAG
jgi:hypothetical protein